MKSKIYNKKVFGSGYSNAYDLLYRDKNYKKECDFLEKVFLKNKGENKVKTILDLGCGTGKHSMILAKRGYKVFGLDASEGMLKEAREKAVRENISIKFKKGDIRNFKIGKKFDAVISMFAVMGYFISPDDLISAFSSAKKHLKPNGVFIFDIWNGIAVLRDKPSKLKKVIDYKDGLSIVRKTAPKLDIFNQNVKINFDLLVCKGSKIINHVKESHAMRFFFPQELATLLKAAGFKNVEIHPFLSLGKPDLARDENWTITVIAK